MLTINELSQLIQIFKVSQTTMAQRENENVQKGN